MSIPFTAPGYHTVTLIQSATDQFWGDRSGTIKDPLGHRSSLATHREDLSPEEIDRRAAEWMKASPDCKS